MFLITAPLIDPFNGEGSRPYSQTKNNLLRQQANAISSTGGLLQEQLIWHYVIQLTSALRYIHAAGLACRTLTSPPSDTQNSISRAKLISLEK